MRKIEDWLIIVALVVFFGLVLSDVLLGCDHDPYQGKDEGQSCSGDETRCINNRFQLCSIESRWETLYDCSEFSMLCCEDDVCCSIDGGAVDGGAP